MSKLTQNEQLFVRSDHKLKDSRQEEKKKNFFLSLGLIIFALCVTGATYAYFALTASNNAITGTVGGATLTLTVNKIVPTTQTTNMIPQLESTLDEAISSTYNCVDDHDNVVCQVYKATITNTGQATAELKGTISFTYTTDTSYTIEEKLPNLKWKRITDATTIGEYNTYQAKTSEQAFEESKVFAPGGTQDYYFVIWIDEIGEEQTDSGTFRANINFESADGEGITSTIKPNYLAQYVINLYNTSTDTITTVHIADDDTNPQVSINSTKGIMLDNNGEYRYYGTDPDNYVEYNNELWRIISIENVKSNEEDTKGKTRVKIIKSTPLTAKETGTDTDITAFSYDSSGEDTYGNGINDWSQSDLMTELNTLYLNSTSGTCYIGKNNTSKLCDFSNTGLNSEARKLTDVALYYLGAPFSEIDYANNYYNGERGNIVWPTEDSTCDDEACPRTTRWTGKIGLMYPSDYAYAVDLSICTTNGYSYSEEGCYNNDWLLYANDSQLTISPLSSTSNSAFRISSSGKIDGNGRIVVAIPYAVFPVLYLKSNVIITEGEGTNQLPFKLALG